MATNTPTLTWETKFSLLTNPNIVKAWVKAMAVVYALIMVIMVPMFIATGEAEGLPVLALIFLAVVLGLTLAGFLIMLIIFGNRSKAKFELSEKGVSYTSLDKTAGTLSRIAILAGGLTGNPGVAGAGLLSVSREKISLSWKAISEARYDEKHSTIRLRNQYRDLLHLYCTPENFSEVKEMVAEKTAQNETQQIAENKRSPLPGALLATVVVVIACMPLYALVEIVDLHLMIPLLIMLFSLAMVWMIPLFAWVVLPLLGWIPVHIALALSKSSTLKLVNTYTYRKYELIDAGEWIVIALAVAGIAYLAWISIRSLRGRYIPVLMRDQMGI